MAVTKRFEKRSLDSIIPYENNPRINDEAVKDVIESIRQTDNLDPIEVDENGVILSGHTRLKALKSLGYTDTEVVVYEGLSEDQKRKYRILANKTQEKAEWDFSKLEKELRDLDFGDFDLGFDFDEPEVANPVQTNEGGYYPEPSLESDDEGFKEYQEPLSDDELDEYSKSADDLLLKRRVIITFSPDREDDIRRMLGIVEEKMRVVYDIDELIGSDEN